MRLLFKYLPKNKIGDFLCSLVPFVRGHKRWPSRKSQLFNDYLFFMKVGNELEKPIRSFTTDKEFLKIFVKSVLGDEYNVETLAILKTSDEIKSFNFPDKCCIKASHSSGWSFIRKNGEPIPLGEITGWLNKNFYDYSRERNYKYLEPKIIIEPLVFGMDSAWDYKVFCFKGRFCFVAIDIDRFTNHKRVFMDRNWKPVQVSMADVSSEFTLPKPSCFEEMVNISEKLSKFFDLVRVDLYTDGNKILVGELTHCIGAAGARFSDLNQEKMLSELLFT